MIAQAARDLSWVSARAGCVLSPGARGVEVIDGERILAQAAFDGWTPAAAEAHFAVDVPIALRTLARASAEYVFGQLGKALLVGAVRSDNERSCGVARRLGFRETHRFISGWAPGVDLVIFEMRREECRWLRG